MYNIQIIEIHIKEKISNQDTRDKHLTYREKE